MTEALFRVSALLAEGEGPESPNVIEINPDLVLFTVLIFILMLVVLGRFAWKPIIAALDARDQGIADDIESARLANEKAQTMLQEHENRLAHAGDEVKQMMAQAKTDAAAARQKILDEANSEAQRQRDRAVAEIAAAKDQAVRELAEKSVDSAVSLAGNLVKRELNRDSHQQLIEDSLDRFVSNN